MSYFTAIKVSKTKMYLAQDVETGVVYFSKGADKLAALIGISSKTVVRNATNKFTTKTYNGFVFAKCKEIRNANRGSDISAAKE